MIGSIRGCIAGRRDAVIIVGIISVEIGMRREREEGRTARKRVPPRGGEDYEGTGRVTKTYLRA